MRALVNITEKAAYQHTTFALFAAAWLCRLTYWLHIHLFLFIQGYIHVQPFPRHSLVDTGSFI